MKATEQKKEEAEKKKAHQKLFTTAKAAFVKAVDDVLHDFARAECSDRLVPFSDQLLHDILH